MKPKFNIPSKTKALLKKIGQLADERGEAAYAVGGFVRDLFLKQPGMDIDITVEGDGLAFAEKLAKLTGSQVKAFTQFGTSIVVVPGFGKVDIATTRTENYASPGALPKVAKKRHRARPLPPRFHPQRHGLEPISRLFFGTPGPFRRTGGPEKGQGPGPCTRRASSMILPGYFGPCGSSKGSKSASKPRPKPGL